MLYGRTSLTGGVLEEETDVWVDDLDDGLCRPAASCGTDGSGGCPIARHLRADRHVAREHGEDLVLALMAVRNVALDRGCAVLNDWSVAWVEGRWLEGCEYAERGEVGREVAEDGRALACKSRRRRERSSAEGLRKRREWRRTEPRTVSAVKMAPSSRTRLIESSVWPGV